MPPPQAQPKATPPEATGILPPILTCASKSRPLEAGGAGLVSEPATGQRKAWQPVGGEVTFTVRSFSEFKNRSRPQVCFQWRLIDPKAAQNYFPADINRVELSSDLRTMKITVTIPNLPPATDAQIRALGIVPIADVRILIQDPESGDPVEVLTVLGVTNTWWALAGAVAIGALAFVGLVFVVRRRLNRAGVPKVNPFLTVISTRAGYASLSQFQIVLWTFVVLISAVYVMALSGELIQITTGTLVLLGISGATTIGAKIQDNKASDDDKKDNGTDKTPPTDTAASQDTTGTVGADDDEQSSTSPMWADLITIKGKGGKPEIHVTRVQMLYFTLITAVFVGLRVFTTYVIPDIPDGFQILMGISNAVYMGSKVTQK